jgi:hypothetical protein
MAREAAFQKTRNHALFGNELPARRTVFEVRFDGGSFIARRTTSDMVENRGRDLGTILGGHRA